MHSLILFFPLGYRTTIRASELAHRAQYSGFSVFGAMATVYLSSTYEDLKEYRRVVFDALRKSSYQVVAMEDFAATDRRPLDKCLQCIDEADIYIGIFAFRYGYIPSAEHGNSKGLSITELEFRCAFARRKPCLIFVAKEDAGFPLQMVDAYSGDGENGKKINQLRQFLLAEKTVSFFSSPHELATLVLAAVREQLVRTDQNHEGSSCEPGRSSTIMWDIDRDGSPYPGLLHFSRKYAPVFFGRDGEIVDILDRLHLPEGHFLIISGGSGMGKSSLVAAGVIPRIEEREISDERKHICVRMVPSQGSTPFDALLRPLHSYAERAGLNVYELGEKMTRQPNILPEKILEIVSKGMNGNAFILFLDQMEELFTTQHPEVSNTFLAGLYGATQQGSLEVIATIRSDHLHHCHGHPEMLRILRGPAHYPLGPVEPFMLSDMIVKPAQCAGLRITDTLARRIVHDTGSEPGNLPLLAFVLHQLFEKRSDHELSAAVYDSLGGVSGAIAKHAKNVEIAILHELGSKASDLLPKLFQSLVIVKEESLPTRRRPMLSGFPSEMNELIDLLVRERLMCTEGDENNATVWLSHEKLFDAWPLLREYVAANKKQLMDQTLLESRAKKWADMGEPWFSGLAFGRERKDFQRSAIPTSLGKKYLVASRTAQWLRTAGIVMPIIFFVFTGAWLWKEGMPVQYALSLVLARLNLLHVTEPKMVHIPGKSFAIGRYEVTFDEYDQFAKLTWQRLPLDQGWGRGDRPVSSVSWEDGVAYARWLSKATGKKYRLPTDDEWVYAASRGGKDEHWAGTSRIAELSEYAWFNENSDGKTQPVGGKKPNGFGFYDMSGNLWEWVQDCGDNPQLGDCGQRFLRGGSWYNGPELLRPSFRYKAYADARGSLIGFRLAQDLN